MTLHQNVQQRAVMHNRRSKLAAFQNRGLIDPAKVGKPVDTTPSKPVDPTPPKVTPASSSSSLSTTIENSATSPSSLSSSTSSSVSTGSSSSVTSSSSSVAPLSNAPVLPAPSSSSTSAQVKATSIPRTVAPLTGSPGSSATAAAASNSAASTSSGLGTGSLIGIIGGSVLGIIAICMVIAFFLRRFRKSQRSADAFNSSQFRRSALMLDEKEQEPDFRPRPPSMIERRNAQPSAPSGGPKASANDFPPPPSMAYPYSDQVPASPAAAPYGAALGGNDHGHGQYPQYGAANPQYGTLPPPPAPSQNGAYSAIPGAYGVPPPGAFGAHYEQAGYGAPPIPGTYAPGAYAPYGAPDPRYPHPQYQYQQQQQQYSNYQQRPAQHAGYAQRADSLTTSNSAASEKQALRLASSPEESSPSRALSLSSSTSSSASSLTRQPTQSGGAPPAYVDEGEGGKWAARRDVKVKPVVLSPSTIGVETGSGYAAAPPRLTPEATAKENWTRPTSAYSAHLAYDQDDAYGGM